MTQETTAQPELLPSTPPTFKMQYVRPDELPPNDMLDGPEPSRQLVESILQYGVVDPIVIRKIDGLDFPYMVLAGSRRIKAVRLLIADAQSPDEDAPEPASVKHLKRIPARIVDTLGDAPADVLTVQSNTLRSRNKVAEYKSVKRLMEAGADEKAIARATGLTHSQIKELLRLDSLNTTLMDAMAEGAITNTLAHDIARMPQATQERLVDTYTANGKLTATDVHFERQARQVESAATLDWNAIGAVPSLPTEPVTAPEPMQPLVDWEHDHDARLAQTATTVVEAMHAAGRDAYQTEVEHDGQRYVVSVSRLNDDGTATPL
jgi:ParB-like chromosome segregation protein Spo0J